MGQSDGFLKYERMESTEIPPKERVKNFNEFHIPLSEEDQRHQAARCMDCGVPFCQYGKMIAGMASGCPLNNLCPEWNDAVYRGNLEEAYVRLSKTNSFPEFTSRVCPALCEKACTCSLDGDAVCTRENERLIIENAFEKGYVKSGMSEIRTGKKIAVIGSGPSGLACADRLARRGHDVTVYERSDRPGGLLMYGIPNMKLEKEIVERRVRLMKEAGVKFITSTQIGASKRSMPQKTANGDPLDKFFRKHKIRYIPPDRITAENDAVVLACGSAMPRDINVAGRDSKGIYFAVDYLRATTSTLLEKGQKSLTDISMAEKSGYVSACGKKILVIGGGDTGNDCVGTCMRENAAEVTQLEMMSRPPLNRAENNPWPQWPRVLKTDYGQQEAIAAFGKDPRIYDSTVREFLSDEEGNVTAARCIKLEWKRENGRMSMKEIEGSEFIVECDMVLIAAGFLGAEKPVVKSFSVDSTERGTVKDTDYRTSRDKVFVCGDMRRGQSLVVWAIKEGRAAAREVDSFLMGYSNI